MQTLNELREQATSLGIDISTEEHQTAIKERRTLATTIATGEQQFKTLDNWLTKAGNFLIHLSMLIAMTVLAPVAIYGLGFVEQQRVEAGVALFDPHNARIMSIVAIGIAILLLVVRARERLRGTGSVHKPRASLRITARKFKYFIGWGGKDAEWQIQYHQDIDQLNRVIWITNILIIILGTAGSMADKMREVSGTWHVALHHIATESTLIDFFTYLGGFAYTAVLLGGLHYVINLNFQLYSQQKPEVIDEQDRQQAIDAEMAYLRAQIAQHQAHQHPEEVVAEATPKQPASFSANGVKPNSIMQE